MRKKKISNVKEECYQRGVEGVASRKSKKNNNVEKECYQGEIGGAMSKTKKRSMKSVIE
jgi:hypothetical protein